MSKKKKINVSDFIVNGKIDHAALAVAVKQGQAAQTAEKAWITKYSVLADSRIKEEAEKLVAAGLFSPPTNVMAECVLKSWPEDGDDGIPEDMREAMFNHLVERCQELYGRKNRVYLKEHTEIDVSSDD